MTSNQKPRPPSTKVPKQGSPTITLFKKAAPPKNITKPSFAHSPKTDYKQMLGGAKKKDGSWQR